MFAKKDQQDQVVGKEHNINNKPLRDSYVGTYKGRAAVPISDCNDNKRQEKRQYNKQDFGGGSHNNNKNNN